MNFCAEITIAGALLLFTLYKVSHLRAKYVQMHKKWTFCVRVLRLRVPRRQGILMQCQPIEITPSSHPPK
jgi:hypothetical protein